ncbi:MAG: ABC transporter ATP-binding protein [Vicinamibacterales bacterium]
MLLRAENVSYGYRAARGAAAFELRDVSVTIPKGSLTALLGPNGGGKTTLVSLLSGVLRPQRGRVLLDGVDLSTLSRRHVARRVAIVPQETHPAFDYTVMEMVLMGRHPHLGPFAIEGPGDLDVAREALSATGTAALADRSYMTLSGGEKQRVIIASALAQSPDLLLLDEPTASLDLGYQLEIAALLGRLNRERQVTLVLATHDLNLAAALCTHVVMIRQGSVVAEGPMGAVLTADGVRALYGVDADVRFHERAGHLTVVPLARVAQ